MASPSCQVNFHPVRIGAIRWEAAPGLEGLLRRVVPPDASPDFIPHGAAVLKTGSRRTVYRLDAPEAGGPVLVKRYRPEGLSDRLRDLVVPCHGKQETHIAKHLSALGISVPEPLAWGSARIGGLAAGSLFICRFLEDSASVIDRLRQSGPAPGLVQAVGRFAAELHRAGIYHPDLHLGNLLAHDTGKGWDLFLVDLHAVDLNTPLTPDLMETNLAMLRNGFVAGRARDFLAGLRAYLEAAPPASLPRSGLARRVWDRAERMLDAFHTRRTARCLKPSSNFAVDRQESARVFRRREFDTTALLDVLRRARETGQGTPLKQDKRTRLTGGLDLSGTAVVVKEYLRGGMGDRLSSALGNGRARRAWVAGIGLEVRGFAAARPLALIEDALGGAVVLSDRSDLSELDRHISRIPAEDRGRLKPLARALGRFLGELHRAGVYHGDLKACNLLVEPADGDFRFHLLDHDRVTFGRPVSLRHRLKNLVQLNTSVPRSLSAALRLRFSRAYLRACPFDGGVRALWTAVRSGGKNRTVVHVTDRGDVIEDPIG